ncbi:MAG: MarR family winged helix-turn-helix transcriptional regulator [Megasphaera sp.]|uniref:MarR family winged helix-turn-helix transcriptional regulator n=1 Tax=Megasphaera sp. TaxID=2023260 RepID=UPI003EFE3076
MMEKTKDVTDIFANLDEKVDIIFRYNMLMNVYQSIPREYTPGFFMSEIEIHTLGFIQRCPGMTAKQICQLTFRTKGTVSSMLSKLEKDGFIEQKVNPENMREHNLYLTEKGEQTCRKHIAFDRRTTADYLMAASEYCTPEEINGYFKLTAFRTKYFEDVLQREKKRYAEIVKERKKESKK